MTEATETKKPAAKAAMPSQKFDLELTAGSSKSAATAAKATKGELLNVPVDAVVQIPGFNVRVETQDYKDHVETIKKSIIANGFYQNKPLSVYAGKDESGANVFFLTDGHTRLRAVKDAIFEGADISTIPVVVKPQTNTPEDLMVALVQDNEGRPLNPYERAVVVKRLEAYDWDNKTIADRLGVTERYVSDLKVLAGAPAKVRDMVLKGKVSATEAIKQLRKDAGGAAEALASAVKDAEAKGKKKATAKNVKAASGGADNGGEGEDEGVSLSRVEKNGKLHTTLKYRFKQGQIVEKDEIKPVWLFNDAAWWDYVDDKTKTHVVINETIAIDVKITSAVPEEDDTDEGDDGAEAEGDAPAQIEDASVDHASGDDNGGL